MTSIWNSLLEAEAEVGLNFDKCHSEQITVTNANGRQIVHTQLYPEINQPLYTLDAKSMKSNFSKLLVAEPAHLYYTILYISGLFFHTAVKETSQLLVEVHGRKPSIANIQGRLEVAHLMVIKSLEMSSNLEKRCQGALKNHPKDIKQLGEYTKLSP